MSDEPRLNVGSSDVGDQAIQREWDRFAMAGHSRDLDSRGVRQAFSWRSSASAARATRAFNSNVDHGASLDFVDDVAGAGSANRLDEDTGALVITAESALKGTFAQSPLNFRAVKKTRWQMHRDHAAYSDMDESN